MTYGELKSLLTGYLHRSDLETLIPSFILLAQARLNHDIKHVILDTTTTIQAYDSTANITLPTGFLHFVRIRVPYNSSYRSLIQQTLEKNASVIENRNGAEGVPKYYAIINTTTAELAPVPEEDLTLNCIYRKKLTALSASGDTDVVLTAFPNAYLYATMLEATPYIVSDKRIGIWKGLYEGEIQRITDADFEARWSDSSKVISNPMADTP